MKSIELTIEIGKTKIDLYITYTFLHGSIATWNDPADPDEVDIHTIEWSEHKRGTYKHLEQGTLYDILCEDSSIYEQICEAEV